MSDDQFSKLSQQLSHIGERVDEQIGELRQELGALRREMNERFEQQDKRFEDLETRMNRRFDQTDKKIAAHFKEFREFERVSFDNLSGHLTTELEALKAEVKETDFNVGKVGLFVEGAVHLLHQAKKERTELLVEQQRLRDWITQLAEHAGIKLAPEM